MVPSTRRRFLHVAAAVAGGLAGCSGLTDGSSGSTRTAAEDDRQRGSGSNRETDPPTLLLRGGANKPPIRFVESDQDRTETYARERRSLRHTTSVIDTQSRSQKLAVADGHDEGSVSAFVDETDFESETLYLHSVWIEECFRLQLCHIGWRSDKVETDYVRELRPYDERCEADEHVYESRLIRIPDALDEGSINSYASSIGGSGPCNPESGRPRAEGSGGSVESGATGRETTDGGEQ